MCCTTMFVHEAAMATTQLRHTACYEVFRPWQEENRQEQKPLRMSWVVVTDENGHRQLRTCWSADRDV